MIDGEGVARDTSAEGTAWDHGFVERPLESAVDLVRLAAIHDIQTLKARYFRLLDTQDWLALREVFTADAVFHARGTAHSGADAIIDFIRGAVGGGVTVHHGHTPEIEVEGSRAKGCWAMADYVELPGQRGFRGYGHYFDDYVRQDGKWLISSSTLTRIREDLLPGGLPGGLPPATTHNLPDKPRS